MGKINFIQPDAIDTWLDGIASRKGGEETARLLKIAVKRHVAAHETTAEELVTMPKDAPVWAMDKWGTGGPFHRFAPELDALLAEKVAHIADWLAAARANGAPFLQDTENGKPKVLLQIKSIDQAAAEADKYFSTLRQKFQRSAISDPQNGLREVRRLSDGMRIVELTSKEALQNESAALRHCVGEGSYDANVLKYESTVIYSLRNRNNEPCATLEALVVDASLKQCRGMNNATPAKKYMKYIEEFTRDFTLVVGGNTSATGLVEDAAEKKYSIYSLPEGLYRPGDLHLEKVPITSLPKGMKIDGDLYLQESKIESLPPDLKVKGTVYLNDLIKDVPEGLHCHRPKKSATPAQRPAFAPPAP